MSTRFLDSWFIVSGNQSGAAFHAEPPIPRMMRHGSAPNYRFNDSDMQPPSWIFELLGGDLSTERRNFTLELPDKDGAEGGGVGGKDEDRLEIRTVQHFTPLPMLSS
jgi:hypothetical protein